MIWKVEYKWLGVNGKWKEAFPNFTKVRGRNLREWPRKLSKLRACPYTSWCTEDCCYRLQIQLLCIFLKESGRGAPLPLTSTLMHILYLRRGIKEKQIKSKHMTVKAKLFFLQYRSYKNVVNDSNICIEWYLNVKDIDIENNIITYIKL